MPQGPEHPRAALSGQAVVEEGPCRHRFHNRWLRGGLSILATRGRRGQGAPSLCQRAQAAPERAEERQERWAPGRGRGQVWFLAPGPGPRGQEGDAGRVTQVASGRGEAAAQRYRAERKGTGTDCGADPAACPGAGRQDLGLGGGQGDGSRGGPPPRPPLPALSLPVSP